MPSSAAAGGGGGVETGPVSTRVTRYAKSTAASVTPVRPGKTHALTALDKAMERHAVHLVLYCRAGPGVDRDALKESISEVLSLYQPMTGRLSRVEDGAGGAGGWIVKCNDAGVRTMDARAAVTLDEWLATASGDEEMDLTYFEPMGPETYIWSPFYVQLTEFTDGSYALGLSCTHLHNDPTAAALFFHGWAAAHLRSISPYPPFYHSPAFRVSPAEPPPAPPLLATKSATATDSTTDAGAAMSSATFHFPAAAMRALLSVLEPGTTPFAALAALFWLRVAGDAAAGESELTLALDFRKKLHAPLPTGYYGSAVHFTRARADLASGLAAVASALDRRVADVPEGELWAAVQWLHARQKAGGEPFQMYGPELTCMALDHVPMYGAEFVADTPPARVTCRVDGATGEGLVIVLPAAEGDASRDVVVTLPAETTARICSDGEVLRYGAEVVAGTKVRAQAKTH